MFCFYIFPHQINLNNYFSPNFCPDVYAETSFLSSVDLKSPHSLICPKSFDLKHPPTLVTPSLLKFSSLLLSWLHSPHIPPSYLNMFVFPTEVSFSPHLLQGETGWCPPVQALEHCPPLGITCFLHLSGWREVICL